MRPDVACGNGRVLQARFVWPGQVPLDITEQLR